MKLFLLSFVFGGFLGALVWLINAWLMYRLTAFLKKGEGSFFGPVFVSFVSKGLFFGAGLIVGVSKLGLSGPWVVSGFFILYLAVVALLSRFSRNLS